MRTGFEEEVAGGTAVDRLAVGVGVVATLVQVVAVVQLAGEVSTRPSGLVIGSGLTML